MRQSIEKLINALREQNGYLGEILKHSHEVRAIIVDMNVDQLGIAVSKERAAIRKMRTAEKNLIDLLPVLAAELGFSANNITLNGIIDSLRPDERSAVLPLRDELIDAIYEISELNSENLEYINTRLDHSQYVVDMLVAEEDPLNNFYRNDGYYKAEQKKSGFYDTQA